MAAVLGGMWAFGGADFWNPVGWVVLIVAAVLTIGYLIVSNWDSIAAFVEWAGSGIASAVSWISETATSIWDSLTHPEPVPVAKPVPFTEPVTIPIAIPVPIAVPIDTDKPSEGGPYNVYDVHVNRPGNYGDYLRGVLDPTPVYLALGEIYKYGITSYGSVLRRYEAFAWTSLKETMILGNLRNRNFGAYEWYATRRSYGQARFIETGLITAYVSIRGKFPPGNTGMY